MTEIYPPGRGRGMCPVSADKPPGFLRAQALPSCHRRVISPSRNGQVLHSRVLNVEDLGNRDRFTHV